MTSLSEVLISESESDSDETRSMFSDSDRGSDDTSDSTVKVLLSYDAIVRSMKKEIEELKQTLRYLEISIAKSKEEKEVLVDRVNKANERN